MDRWSSGWICLGLLLLLPTGAVFSDEADEDLGEEEGLMEEADFPDLVGVSETGGIMDAGRIHGRVDRALGGLLSASRAVNRELIVRRAGADPVFQQG